MVLKPSAPVSYRLCQVFFDKKLLAINIECICYGQELPLSSLLSRSIGV